MPHHPQNPHLPSDIPPRPDPTPGPRLGHALLVVVLIWAALVAIRLSGPTDILDNDQLRPAAYANDAVVNDNWLVQTDWRADIASKPPLTTWIIGALSLPVGHATRLTLTIPSAGAVLGCALLTLFVGARRFGASAGLLGAAGLLLSPMGLKQVTLVRTDAVYGFLVALAAILAWRAWNRGSGWTWFWLACAGVTLTKGPLGVALAATGLIAILWERASRNTREPDAAPLHRPLRPTRARRLADHALGLTLLLAIVGAWFLLAWRAAGEPFVAKVLGDELVGHALRSGRGDLPFSGFYKPPLYYLSRFAPASVFTFLALWTVARSPSPDPETRRFERFLFCAFLGAMAIFCASPHQRPDLLTPLWVVGAILAGRELAKLVATWRRPVANLALGAGAALALAGALALQHTVAPTTTPAIRARAIAALAHDVNARAGSLPMLHAGDHASLRFFLGVMEHNVEPSVAADALAGPAPILVAADTDDPELDRLLHERRVNIVTVAQWQDDSGWGVRVLANLPAARQIGR